MAHRKLMMADRPVGRAGTESCGRSAKFGGPLSTWEPRVVPDVEFVSIEGHRLNLSTVRRSTGAGEPWSLLAALDNGGVDPPWRTGWLW